MFSPAFIVCDIQYNLKVWPHMQLTNSCRYFNSLFFLFFVLYIYYIMTWHADLIITRLSFFQQLFVTYLTYAYMIRSIWQLIKHGTCMWIYQAKTKSDLFKYFAKNKLVLFFLCKYNYVSSILYFLIMLASWGIIDQYNQ